MCPQTLKIAAVALDTTPLDWDGNLAHIRLALDGARAAGAQVVCLPELALSGVGCEDAFLAPFVPEMALAALQALLPETRGLTVAVGLPLAVGGQLFNAAALIADGRLLGFGAKRCLADDRLSYEARWFAPWTPASPTLVAIGGQPFSLGTSVFEVNGLAIALCIGGDVSQVPLPAHADVILNVNARPFSFGEQAEFERQLVELTRSHTVPRAIASSNLVGNEAGTLIYAGGALVVHEGRLLSRSPRFSFRPMTAAIAEVARSGPATGPDCDGDPFASKEEEFARAVALGLFGYLHKSRMSRFALSLSGGADSASIAALVMLMARFSLCELGSAGVAQALRLGEGFPPDATLTPGDSGAALDRAVAALMPRLLITAYQGTRNSSQTTREAARAVARAVGSRHLELDIEPIVARYRAAVEGALGRTFDWQRDDATLQNIQARVRGPSIWMIANAEHALLLATSNRSEAAVGYATMDGDTCGGLAPIAGIDKAWLRHWLAWLESVGPMGGHPIHELALVNAQAPTAELRPAEAGQTDEGDLMPYAILDDIERLAIHQGRSPAATFDTLRVRHPERTPQQLLDWVSLFFRMFARSQWKRARSAPGFHLDEANLSPGSWCRFPLLCGGFARELAELRDKCIRDTDAQSC